MTCFRATAKKRFVILDLETVWCHWCHVMEKTTYSDPKVIELLDSKYLPVQQMAKLKLAHTALDCEAAQRAARCRKPRKDKEICLTPFLEVLPFIAAPGLFGARA